MAADGPNFSQQSTQRRRTRLGIAYHTAVTQMQDFNFNSAAKAGLHLIGRTHTIEPHPVILGFNRYRSLRLELHLRITRLGDGRRPFACHTLRALNQRYINFGNYMPIQFEPTNSFCYNFARYEVLPAIIAAPEVQTGQPFRLVELVKQIVDQHLLPDQQVITYPRAQTGKLHSIINTIKWYVPFLAKSTKQLAPLGDGMYRLPDPVDIDEVEAEAEDAALDDDVSEASVSEGFIYAFSFPALIKQEGAFPIKIGMTVNDVQQRVVNQCKGSAIFDNPKVLDSWKVSRVGFVESAIHKVLAARGKWREGVPGTEWFDTTVDEIESIINFTGAH